MKGLTVSGGLLLLVLAFAVGSSSAAGPNDGVYLVTQGTPPNTKTYFMTIHQNDAALGPLGFNLLVGIMDAEAGTWDYTPAIRTGNNVQGRVYDGETAIDREPHLFDVALNFTSATTFSGTITQNGAEIPISGQLVF